MMLFTVLRMPLVISNIKEKSQVNHKRFSIKSIFRISFAAVNLLLLSSCISSNKSVVGVYKGTIPAADCPGINVLLKLDSNSKYEMTFNYIDRSSVYVEDGIWKIVKGIKGEGDLVEIKTDKTASYLLIINNGRLEFLDADGRKIMSGGNYTLHREL